MRLKAGSGVSAAFARSAVLAVLDSEKAERRQVSVYLTDDPEIRRVHRDHMGIDTATDVISFWIDAKSPEARAGFLGELVVSFQTAKRVSKEMELPFREEVARYLVHGTLHLLGWNDKYPAERKHMHARQEAILAKFLGKGK